jgi:hypothetical protein
LERTAVYADAHCRIDGIEGGHYNFSLDNCHTALMEAVKSSSVECIRLLLEKGADARKACLRDSRTPLHCLATPLPPDATGRESNAKDILDMLLAAGADLEARDAHGETPLILCFPPRDRARPTALPFFTSCWLQEPILRPWMPMARRSWTEPVEPRKSSASRHCWAWVLTPDGHVFWTEKLPYMGK